MSFVSSTKRLLRHAVERYGFAVVKFRDRDRLRQTVALQTAEADRLRQTLALQTAETDRLQQTLALWTAEAHRLQQTLALQTAEANRLQQLRRDMEVEQQKARTEILRLKVAAEQSYD